MKFANKLDLELFLTEVDRLDLINQVDESFEPSQELLESFIKRRKPLVGAIKDFRKSQMTKEQWRQKRWKFMRGMQRFHNSVAGKRFHRNMGRFLSSRYFYPKMRSVVKDDQERGVIQGSKIKEEFNIYDLAEILKAISSCKTHSYIELEYFFPLEEEIEYWEFLDTVLPALDKVEGKLWLNEEFGSSDLEVLFRLTEKKELIKAFAERCQVDSKEIERIWNQFMDINKERLDEDLYLDLVEFIWENIKTFKEEEISETT